MDGRDIMNGMPDTGDDSLGTWLERLSAAPTEEAVLETCSRYIASIGAQRLATLPQRCLPTSLQTPAELSDYALELVRHTLDEPSCAELARDLAEFFAYANSRMAQVIRDRERRPALVRLFTATSQQVAREIDSNRTPD